MQSSVSSANFNSKIVDRGTDPNGGHLNDEKRDFIENPFIIGAVRCCIFALMLICNRPFVRIVQN